MGEKIPFHQKPDDEVYYDMNLSEERFKQKYNGYESEVMNYTKGSSMTRYIMIVR